MIVIKDGPEFNKIYASVAFDKWGSPTNQDIRVVEDLTNIPKDATIYDATKPFESDFQEYCNMIENTLWIFNNEPIKIRDTEVYMTGGGVNWMFHKGPVYIYEINKVQIQFINELIKNWHGKNYGEFVYNFLKNNKIFHFHINLNEKQNSNHKLISNKQNFIDKINENFNFLIKKYSPEWKWQPNNVSVNNGDIIKLIPKKYIGKFLLSNVFNFKYYFVKCFVKNAYDLLSPSTRAFIKKVKPKNNPYKDPPCKKLDLNVPTKEIYSEIQNIKKYLVNHRNESGLGWESFCIHGKSFNATREAEYYNDNRPYIWTKEAVEYMPNTITFLKSLGFKRFERVRVMCLNSKGFINAHKDQTDSGLGPINIAINHPNECKFYLENHGELKFKSGDAYQLNLVNYHAVINNSNIPRYHIIIHGSK